LLLKEFSFLIYCFSCNCGRKNEGIRFGRVWAAIVMYDAAGVRRAAGKQAKVLNKLIFSQKDEDRKNFDENLKELIGHSPFEVFVGAMLGMLIGLCFA